MDKVAELALKFEQHEKRPFREMNYCIFSLIASGGIESIDAGILLQAKTIAILISLNMSFFFQLNTFYPGGRDSWLLNLCVHMPAKLPRCCWTLYLGTALLQGLMLSQLHVHCTGLDFSLCRNSSMSWEIRIKLCSWEFSVFSNIHCLHERKTSGFCPVTGSGTVYSLASFWFFSSDVILSFLFPNFVPLR